MRPLQNAGEDPRADEDRPRLGKASMRPPQNAGEDVYFGDTGDAHMRLQ